jgi:hypothetical protein
MRRLIAAQNGFQLGPVRLGYPALSQRVFLQKLAERFDPSLWYEGPELARLMSGLVAMDKDRFTANVKIKARPASTLCDLAKGRLPNPDNLRACRHGAASLAIADELTMHFARRSARWFVAVGFHAADKVAAQKADFKGCLSSWS